MQKQSSGKLNPCHETKVSTFSSNILKSSFSVRWHQSLILSWRNNSSLFFTELFQCIEVFIYAHHFIQVEVWSLTGPTLIPFFFNHSVVDLLLCIGSLAYCANHFWLSFSCRPDDPICDSNILWYRELFTD